jgi:hypothetical protein
MADYFQDGRIILVNGTPSSGRQPTREGPLVSLSVNNTPTNDVVVTEKGITNHLRVSNKIFQAPKVLKLDNESKTIYFDNPLVEHQVEVYKYCSYHSGPHIHVDKGEIYSPHLGNRFRPAFALRKDMSSWKVPLHAWKASKKVYLRFAYRTIDGIRSDLSTEVVILETNKNIIKDWSIFRIH